MESSETLCPTPPRRPLLKTFSALSVLGALLALQACSNSDDVVTTARTLCQAAAAIRARGALDVYAGVTHGVFCPGALDRIEASPIKQVVVTDTLNHAPGTLGTKVQQLPVAGLLGEAVQRIHEERSLSSLFV